MSRQGSALDREFVCTHHARSKTVARFSSLSLPPLQEQESGTTYFIKREASVLSRFLLVATPDFASLIDLGTVGRDNARHTLIRLTESSSRANSLRRTLAQRLA